MPTKQNKQSQDIAKNVYDHYMTCFERVYKTMEENYYRPITREGFDRFMAMFNKDIYDKIPDKKERSNFVCWRSSAYLVDYLKDPEDTFSGFYPPKAADKYAKTALDQRVDLGIEGKLIAEGYIVTHVEPRSDAYAQGLREDDILQLIDGVKILTLSEEAIQKLLTPIIDTKVTLDYVEVKTKAAKTIRVLSQEYFKQSVFLVPVDVPGVYCLQIKHFNRKTAEDMFRFLSLIEKEGEAGVNSGLIIDLRGNPGGPPLAAREISAFFLTPGEDFAYFQRKGENKSALDVPVIKSEYRYTGPIAILVNKESGSASELFSGIMQKRGRAMIVGTNTAGKVMLKSMFDYEDGSMLLLVTARGYMYDGTVFPFIGLMPNMAIDDTIDAVHFAALQLKAKMGQSESQNN